MNKGKREQKKKNRIIEWKMNLLANAVTRCNQSAKMTVYYGIVSHWREKNSQRRRVAKREVEKLVLC